VALCALFRDVTSVILAELANVDCNRGVMNRSLSRYFSPAQPDSLSPISRSETRITFVPMAGTSNEDCKLAQEIVFGRTHNMYPNASTCTMQYRREVPFFRALFVHAIPCVYSTRAPVGFRSRLPHSVRGKLITLLRAKAVNRDINTSTGIILNLDFWSSHFKRIYSLKSLE